MILGNFSHCYFCFTPWSQQTLTKLQPWNFFLLWPILSIPPGPTLRPVSYLILLRSLFALEDWGPTVFSDFIFFHSPNPLLHYCQFPDCVNSCNFSKTKSVLIFSYAAPHSWHIYLYGQCFSSSIQVLLIIKASSTSSMELFLFIPTHNDLQFSWYIIQSHTGSALRMLT